MRVCFRSSVKPSQIPEYRRRHAAVWPEMLRALKAPGWNNYSLFLRRRRAADRLRRDATTSTQPGPGWRPPRSTPAGRPRWPPFFDDLARRAGPGLPPAHRNLQSRGPVVRGQRRRGQPPTAEGTIMNTSETALGRLGELAIEVPSWAFGNSGTRFKVFGTPGTPRTIQEKMADAAKVHELTGLAPTRGAAHPLGQGRRLRGPAEYRRGPRRGPRHHQLQHLPGRRATSSAP